MTIKSTTIAEVTAAAADDPRLTRRARVVIATIAGQIAEGRDTMTQSEIAFANGRSRAFAQAGVVELQTAGYLRIHRDPGPLPARFELTLPDPLQRSATLPNLNSRRKRPRRAPDELPAARLEELIRAVERLTRLIQRRLPASAKRVQP